MKPEEILKYMLSGGDMPTSKPDTSDRMTPEQMEQIHDTADAVREVVDRQRNKLLESGYPEDVALAMVAHMWCTIWTATLHG